MYFRRVVELILSGNWRPGQLSTISLRSVFPVIGESEPNLAKMYTFVAGTPTSFRSVFKRSIADFASGGRRTYASTFLRDFPAEMTISILKIGTLMTIQIIHQHCCFVCLP